MSEHTIVITTEALANIQNMLNKVHETRASYGDHSDQHIALSSSLAISLARMMQLKPTRIMADNSHSLYCHSEHIVFGVNFHDGSGWSINS